LRVLVTGATGAVGRGALHGLLAERVVTRGPCRDPKNAHLPSGVELRVGDLNEPDTVVRALDGVSAVFLYAQ
jgi:uncharacterized protein YbjT (DUF2867 family)